MSGVFDFVTARRRGDSVTVRAILDAEKTKANEEQVAGLANEVDVHGSPCLLLTTNLEICEILLKARGNPNSCDFHGSSALHRASERGLKDVCKLLVDFLANVGAVDGEGVSAVACAAGAGKIGVCELLLGCGADPRVSDQRGRSAFHHAVRAGDRGVCGLLLARAGRFFTRKIFFSTTRQGRSRTVVFAAELVCPRVSITFRTPLVEKLVSSRFAPDSVQTIDEIFRSGISDSFPQ